MGKTLIKLGETEIEKQKFHQYKRSILIKKTLHINKIVVAFNQVSFGKKGFKYFIGYGDANKIALYVYFTKK